MAGTAGCFESDCCDVSEKEAYVGCGSPEAEWGLYRCVVEQVLKKFVGIVRVSVVN